MNKKGLTVEQWDKIGIDILTRENEREKTIDENKSILPKLRKNAQELGFEFKNDRELNGICFTNPNIFKQVLLDFYKETPYIVEKEYILQCLGSHKNSDLIDFYLDELHKHTSKLIRYAICNCIMRIPNKNDIDKYIDLLYSNNYPEVIPYVGICFAEATDSKYKDKYLKMLCDSKLGRKRLYVVQAIGKLKLKEAIPQLIELLKDEDLREDVVDALGKYKNVELLQYFVKYENDENQEVRKAALRGIKAIEKIQNK
jgi:hypothetical protein